MRHAEVYTPLEPPEISASDVRVAFVGDLLLAPPPDGYPYPRRAELVSEEIRRLFHQQDIVFGNLECALAGEGPCVPTEPRVIASVELVRAVQRVGFDVVSLANNHTFDRLQHGFEELRRFLGDLRLRHFGAGMNLREAAAPAIVEAGGVRIAFLGAADRRSGTGQFAGENQWGVALLDVDRIAAEIRQLRGEVDHVLVSVHWGEERFSIPSPVQVEQAHALVDAGATMLIGHHPHVLQGMEVYRGAPIVYSLGNFVADEVHFTDGHVVRWNRTGRTGALLLATLGKKALREFRLVPTYDTGLVVELDRSGYGPGRIARTSRALVRGVTPRRYRREHLWVKAVKPALGYLRWERLMRLRWRHVRKAIGLLRQSRTAD